MMGNSSVSHHGQDILAACCRLPMIRLWLHSTQIASSHSVTSSGHD
jgi:hypothetical protein